MIIADSVGGSSTGRFGENHTAPQAGGNSRQNILFFVGSAPAVVYDKYLIRKGDTLSGIALKFKDRDTREAILKRNAIQDPNRLTVGKSLLILPARKTEPDKRDKDS